MKKIEKIKKSFLLLLTLTVALSSFSISFAVENSYEKDDEHKNANSLVWVPQITSGFNTIAQNGVYVTEESGTLSLTFDGSAQRVKNTVKLDISGIKKGYMKYISFDLTAESLMDLVVTADKEGETGTERPLSLFLDDYGNLAASSNSWSESYAEGGSFCETVPDVYYNSGDGIKYERNRNYNIKMVLSGKDGSIAIYADGKKIGKNRYESKDLTAFRSDYISFVHYTTREANDTVHLKNLQIGYCSEYGQYTEGKYETENDFYSFPKGSNKWIKLTVDCDSRFSLQTDDGLLKVNGFENWGYLANKDTAEFSSYDRAYSDGKIPVWQNREKIEVVFGKDETEKKVFAFTDDGMYAEYAYTSTPTGVSVDGAKVSEASYGSFVQTTGIFLCDSDDRIISGFGETDGKIKIGAYGAGVGDEICVLYSFYDNEDVLLKTDCKVADTSCDGVYVLSPDGGLEVDKVPENAQYMKLFVFESLRSIKPLAQSIVLADYSEEYIRCTFDDNESYCRVLLGDDEVACMSIYALAELTGGDCTGKTIIWSDAEISFREGNRLAQFDEGNLLLQCEPFMDKGELFVPISVLEPTKSWAVYYDRFNDLVEIKTGTAYPTDKPTIYNASAYGAVGDGVTDDGPAITMALNAAIVSGRPAKVMLDKGKTYLIGERSDCMSYFEIKGVSNLTFDGQGSTVLIEKCTNTFMRLEDCANVKVQNVDVDYVETAFTQGKITQVYKRKNSESEEYFILEIDEGYPLPPSDKWVQKLYVNSTRPEKGGWWFGSLIDPVEDRLKFQKYQAFFIDSVTHVEGRKYKVSLGKSSHWWTTFMAVGDRFVINTRFSAYDISDTTHDGSTSMIEIMTSSDITFYNVSIYGAPWMGVSVGMNYGRINFLNFGERLREGRLMCINSDGIHCWRNKEGVTVRNSTFMNSLDDQINTKGEDAIILSGSGDEFVVDYNLNFRVGDKLIFLDKGDGTNATDKVIRGTAYLKSFRSGGGGIILTLDRSIDGAKVGDLVYNSDSSTSGSVIEKNTFKNSRRHAYITRSENSLFQDNTVIDCGGSMVSGSNEFVGSSSEGPFPSSMTVRRNTMTAPRTTDCYPIEVMSWNSTIDSSRAIKGLLLENNEIDVPCCDYNTSRPVSAIKIDAVDGLYMINNKIKSTAENESEYTVYPVYITNSRVEIIDGIECNFANPSSSGSIVMMKNCDFYAADIKNITDLSGFAQTGYKAE